MSPKEHTAIGIAQQDGPLTSFNLPTPSPKANEILVKVLYVGFSPLSQWQVDFGLLVNKWPVVLGGSVVGSVVEIGEGVGIEDIRKGDKVSFEPIEGYYGDV